MGRYLPNPALTVERIAELKASLDFAEYELAAAVSLAKTLGLSWDQIGVAIGGGKQGASQWAKRRGVTTLNLEPSEADRIGKLIAAGEKATRYAVREIASGKVGVTKVTRRTLSTHLKLEVAEERARKRDGAEVWMLEADGTETELRIRPRRSTFGRTAHDTAAADDFFG